MKTLKYFAILIILAITVAVNTAQSQTASDENMSNLQKKYWVYRNRFFDEYIAANTDILTKYDYGKVGSNIPAGIRHIFKTSSASTSEKDLSWGDGTIYLSQYISVLATEYKLFKDNNRYQDLSEAKTLEYLIAALNAFNRLDATAESFYRPNPDENINYRHNPSLDLNYLGDRQDDMNGFYVRDDIPGGFFDPLYPFLPYSGHLKADGTINTVSSDNIGLSENNFSNYQKECSKDQGWHMLLSLALVKECVGSTETGDFFYYGTKTIRWMVQNIAERIVKAMHNSTGDDPWTLINPATGKSVSDHRQGAGDITESGYGGLAYAFGAAGTRISDVDCHHNNSQNQKWQFKEGLYRIIQLYLPNKYHEAYHHFCLATIIGGVVENSNDETFKYLLSIVNIAGYHEHLPLIFALLHGQTNMHTDHFNLKQHSRNLLNNAPDCGPYRYGSGEYGNISWTSSNRLYGVQNLVEISGGGVFTGDYNGLDYLLLYNLYQLVYGYNSEISNVPIWNNLIFNVPWTWLGVVHGSNNNPETWFAKETMTYKGTMEINADETFVAGQKITFKPGTHIKNGAKLKAYIDNGLYYHLFAVTPCVGVAGARFMQDTTITNEKLVLKNEESKETKLNLAGSEINQQEYYSINITKNETTLNNKNTESFTSSNVTSNIKQNAAYSVTVYPNPNTGKFLVEINGTVPTNTTVELRDLLGKTVYSGSMSLNSSTIDLTGSPARIYFITVCAGKDCWLGKVVKE